MFITKTTTIILYSFCMQLKYTWIDKYQKKRAYSLISHHYYIFIYYSRILNVLAIIPHRTYNLYEFFSPGITNCVFSQSWNTFTIHIYKYVIINSLKYYKGMSGSSLIIHWYNNKPYASLLKMKSMFKKGKFKHRIVGLFIYINVWFVCYYFFINCSCG